jgi:regulator of sigma E protease
MFITILVFVAILSVLVLIHELGHFITALVIGVKVEEFGFGLPPRIVGKKIRGIIYSLNWLPIGGFVKLAGEDESESDHPVVKNRKQYFFARSKKERAAILLAGVFMNFVLAVGITTYLLTQGVQETAGRVHIEQVLTASPAEQAGLKPNDIIENFTTPQDVITFAKNHAGTPVTFTILRDNKILQVTLTPRKTFPKGEGPVGIAISDQEIKKYSLSRAPVEATKINVERAWEMIAGIGMLLARLAQLKPVGSDVAGPIGIAQVTGQAVKFGWKAVLEFMSILSLNLAVLNVLPIPALDGGRLAFVILEKFIGKRVKPAFEQSTHQIGMIVLFILVILISINDILRIAHGG